MAFLVYENQFICRARWIEMNQERRHDRSMIPCIYLRLSESRRLNKFARSEEKRSFLTVDDIL